MSVLELTEEIELLLEEQPDRRKKKEYKEWVAEINKKIETVNAAAKFKIYGIVK